MNLGESKKDINNDGVMKKCPKCGWLISKMAKFCPNCNYVFAENTGTKTNEHINYKNKPEKSHRIFSIAVILITLSIVFSFLSKLNKEERADNGNKHLSKQNLDMAEFHLAEYGIYNENDVEIICTGNKSGNNVSLGFYVENNSKKDIEIGVTGIGINNMSFSENSFADYVHKDIMSGNKSNFSVELDKDVLLDNGINIIKKIELMLVLHIGNSDGIQINEIIYTDMDDDKYIDISGTKVYSDDNFDIQYLGNNGKRFKFSIFNKGFEYLDYYLDKCSVNDYSFDLNDSITNISDEPLFRRSYSIFEIIIDDEFCEKNSIDNIEKIEFTMYAENDASMISTGGDIETDRITVEFE